MAYAMIQVRGQQKIEASFHLRNSAWANSVLSFSSSRLKSDWFMVKMRDQGGYSSIYDLCWHWNVIIPNKVIQQKVKTMTCPNQDLNQSLRGQITVSLPLDHRSITVKTDGQVISSIKGERVLRNFCHTVSGGGYPLTMTSCNGRVSYVRKGMEPIMSSM